MAVGTMPAIDVLFAGMKCIWCGKVYAECKASTCPAERKAEAEAERLAYETAFVAELEGLERDTGRTFRNDVAMLRHVRRIVREHVKAKKRTK